jgi:hypothetical protein
MVAAGRLEDADWGGSGFIGLWVSIEGLLLETADGEPASVPAELSGTAWGFVWQQVPITASKLNIERPRLTATHLRHAGLDFLLD